jgi:hypothetical protein
VSFGYEKEGSMTEPILTDMQISDITCSCVINAPIENVDLATWLFKLSEGEYRRCCPPDHISCGTTLTDEGKPLVLNVEMIGHGLMIQRYVAETATPTSCKRTLNVRKIDENTCELVSSMTVHPTAEFMDFIAQHKIKFKDAAAARQRVEGEHSLRETPLMAASIERMALGQAHLPSRSVGAA